MDMMLVDVAVYSAFAKSRARCAVVPGFAAAAGENAKLCRYGDQVHPLVFECLGRPGHKSMLTLQELAAWAVAASPGQMLRQAALVRRWRSSLERVLLYEKADLLVQSLGGTGADWG